MVFTHYCQCSKDDVTILQVGAGYGI